MQASGHGTVDEERPHRLIRDRGAPREREDVGAGVDPGNGGQQVQHRLGQYLDAPAGLGARQRHGARLDGDVRPLHRQHFTDAEPRQRRDADGAGGRWTDGLPRDQGRPQGRHLGRRQYPVAGNLAGPLNPTTGVRPLGPPLPMLEQREQPGGKRQRAVPRNRRQRRDHPLNITPRHVGDTTRPQRWGDGMPHLLPVFPYRALGHTSRRASHRHVVGEEPIQALRDGRLGRLLAPPRQRVALSGADPHELSPSPCPDRLETRFGRARQRHTMSVAVCPVVEYVGFRTCRGNADAQTCHLVVPQHAGSPVRGVRLGYVVQSTCVRSRDVSSSLWKQPYSCRVTTMSPFRQHRRSTPFMQDQRLFTISYLLISSYINYTQCA